MALKNKGSTLVLVLLLVSLFLVMGMAFLGKRAPQYRSAKSAANSIAAKEVALAGLEDVWIKLQKDKYFPPLPAFDQPTFTYWETLKDPAGDPVGTYVVTIETWALHPPWRIYRINVVGHFGIDPVLATRKLTVEFDRSQLKRDVVFPSLPVENRNHARFMNFVDEGAVHSR